MSHSRAIIAHLTQIMAGVFDTLGGVAVTLSSLPQFAAAPVDGGLTIPTGAVTVAARATITTTGAITAVNGALNTGSDFSDLVNKFKGGSSEGTGKVKSSMETKIEKQATKRGWTKDSIDDAVNKPAKTVKTSDTRNNPATGKKNNDPATAYYDKDGGYVVRNDRTGDIVQVSDKNDPNWVALWDN